MSFIIDYWEVIFATLFCLFIYYGLKSIRKPSDFDHPRSQHHTYIKKEKSNEQGRRNAANFQLTSKKTEVRPKPIAATKVSVKEPKYDRLGHLIIKPDCTINYIDRNGDITGRNISIAHITDKGGNALLLAYCFIREEQRSFDMGRIISIVDHDTGEMIEGTESCKQWLIWFYSHNNVRFIPKIPRNEPSQYVFDFKKNVRSGKIEDYIVDCTISYRTAKGYIDKDITIFKVEKTYVKLIISSYSHSDKMDKKFYLSHIRELKPKGKRRLVSDKGIRNWLISHKDM